MFPKLLIFPLFAIALIFACGSQSENKKEKEAKKDTTKENAAIIIVDSAQTKASSPIIEEELFRINFPESPERIVDSADQSMQYIVSQQDDSVRYMLYYRDYEPGKIQKYGEMKFLENQEKQVIDKHEFKQKDIVENKEISMHGYQGKSLKAGAAGNFFLVYRIYLVENRAYQLSISSVKGYPSEKDIALFFDSFQLKSPPKKTVKS